MNVWNSLYRQLQITQHWLRLGRRSCVADIIVWGWKASDQTYQYQLFRLYQQCRGLQGGPN